MTTRPEARKKAGYKAAVDAVATLEVLVVHGPNLNLLGEREARIYGHTRLADIDDELKRLGEQIGIRVETFQSNSEGDIVTRIQQAHGKIDALLINPAGYTHTSVAIRDAVLALDVPTVEVHLTNVYRREPIRHHSTVADVVTARIMGFGAPGYELALRGVRDLVEAAHAKRGDLASGRRGR